MKRILALLSLTALCGCNPPDSDRAIQVQYGRGTNSGYFYCEILVIEGCEYIHTGESTLIHKGNCTNSIHAHNQ